jgi:2-phosphosulfolactate phosphatase
VTTPRRRWLFIDALPDRAARHADRTIVAIDVIRATTFALTAVADGRRCIVAGDVDEAVAIRDRLGDAVLAGEIAGVMPEMFDLNNSPADLVARTDVGRPVVMVSSSGAVLMLEAARRAAVTYVACLRNVEATVRRLADGEGDVALIGAGSRGEFREEDQLCCGWIGRRLLEHGFTPEDGRTAEIIQRWGRASVESAEVSNSIRYLRQSGQLRDWDFIQTHVDDLDIVPAMRGNEVVTTPVRAMAETPA